MSRIAVVGSGYMGGGIAQVAAIAGHEVVITDATPEIARANLDRINAEADAFEAQGLFPEGAAAAVRHGIAAADDVESAVIGADLVEEAVPERLELKRGTLARISRANPDAVIGSNTSTIALGQLAPPVENSHRFLGVHFSNPAPFIPGVEIIPHDGTSEEAIATAEEFVRSVGKLPARVRDVTGFVLNRLQYALFHEATQLVEEGVASVSDIDTIVRSTFGFRMPFFGPFAIADMAGLDVYAFCYASLQEGLPDRFPIPSMLSEKIAAGQLGTKSGGGFRAIDAARTDELIAYRNRAYVLMARLLQELGPSPFDDPR